MTATSLERLAIESPNFKAQLDRSFGGDLETTALFQRICFLCLSGVPLPEPTVIAFVGPKASGKSTLLWWMHQLLGQTPVGYSTSLDGYVLTGRIPTSEQFVMQVEKARMISVDGVHKPIKANSVINLLQVAKGAKLIIESHTTPVIDGDGVKVVVVPFQRDGK